MVIAVGHGDETIIGGVMDCAEQDTVQFDKPAFFVKFVFSLRARWNFDEGTHHLGGVLSWGDIVPGILC